jgi:ATPase subunit of ABC transporter with duplicated ATPase domains
MSHSQILINQMSFKLPTDKTLFNELNLVFSKHKTGLVGRNGVGKSTLIKLILGELCPNSGSIHTEGRLAYVPQNFPISSEITIAELLGYKEKINALHRITKGSIDLRDFSVLNEEWDIEERMHNQLAAFGLNTIPHHRQLKMLSGGEVTRLLPPVSA